MSKNSKKSDVRKERQQLFDFTFSMMEQNAGRTRKQFAEAMINVTKELEDIIQQYHKLQHENQKSRRDLDVGEMKLRTLQELVKQTEYIIEIGEDIVNKFSLLSVDALEINEKELTFIFPELERWRERVRRCEWYKSAKSIETDKEHSQKEIVEKQKELIMLQAKIKAFEYIDKVGSLLEDKPIERVKAIIRQAVRRVTPSLEYAASQDDIFDDEKSEEETA